MRFTKRVSTPFRVQIISKPHHFRISINVILCAREDKSEDSYPCHFSLNFLFRAIKILPCIVNFSSFNEDGSLGHVFSGCWALTALRSAWTMLRFIGQQTSRLCRTFVVPTGHVPSPTPARSYPLSSPSRAPQIRLEKACQCFSFKQPISWLLETIIVSLLPFEFLLHDLKAGLHGWTHGDVTFSLLLVRRLLYEAVPAPALSSLLLCG